MPKVSVCVMTYNQENYIYDCLMSIVTQKTDFLFEVLVADDGSTDETKDIILNLASKYSVIKLFFRKENIGPSKNFIDIHNQATLRSPYVCHCDGDDKWLPEKLQKQVDFLENNLDFSAVWTNVSYIQDEINDTSINKYTDINSTLDGVIDLGFSIRFCFTPIHSSIMYRSSVRKTRSIDHYVIDLFYTQEFLSHGKGKILHHVLTQYRLSSINSISKKNKILHYKLQVYYAKEWFRKDSRRWRNDVFFCALYRTYNYARHKNPIAFYWAKVLFATFSFGGLLYFQKARSQVNKICRMNMQNANTETQF
ncbi:MAG: glycosyltransferase [Gammaproteobacteria bacterium]|nr:glycosyltransferase [Gammaproteobacteria bacterium]